MVMWLVAKLTLEKTSIHGCLEIETRSSSRSGRLERVNSHSSGHNRGSNVGSGVIGVSGHILVHICQDAMLGQGQDI